VDCLEKENFGLSEPCYALRRDDIFLEKAVYLVKFSKPTSLCEIGTDLVLYLAQIPLEELIFDIS